MLVNMPRRMSATMNSTKEEEEEEEEGQVSEKRKPAGFFGCMLPDTDGRLSRPPHRYMIKRSLVSYIRLC